LREAGVQLPENPGPIIGIHLGTSFQVNRLKHALLKANILPPFSSYSGNGVEGWFRFALSSEHSRQQLENLVRALKPFAPAVIH